MFYKKITLQLLAVVITAVFTIVFLFLIVMPGLAVKKTSSARNQQSSAASEQELQSRINSVPDFGRFTYGKSGLGEDLVCYKISAGNKGGRKILMTYEIHGYEDLYPKDGQVLVDIGNAVVKYFSENRNLLKNCELYVVPSANPDGLARGVSNNGIGRCQISLGVNINRDFDYCFKQFADDRNHTLDKPFSAPESRALRDLVETIKPDAVIDSHGWESGFIGDTALSDCYRKFMNGYALKYDKPQFSADENGFFSAWAGTQAKHALLVEYPPAAAQLPEQYQKETFSSIALIISTLCG